MIATLRSVSYACSFTAFTAEGIEEPQPNEKEGVMQIVTSWMEEGIEQGIEQGLQQGQRKVILRQLRRRCGGLASETEQQIQHLPADKLESLADALFDFTSEPDLNTWLQANASSGESHH